MAARLRSTCSARRPTTRRCSSTSAMARRCSASRRSRCDRSWLSISPWRAESCSCRFCNSARCCCKRALRLVELLLPGRQLLGGLPQRLFAGGLLRAGFGGPLLQFRDPLAEPEPGRAEIAFQLRAAGVAARPRDDRGLSDARGGARPIGWPGCATARRRPRLRGQRPPRAAASPWRAAAIGCGASMRASVERPRGRHAGGTLAMASLGGRHVDQPGEEGRWPAGWQSLRNRQDFPSLLNRQSERSSSTQAPKAMAVA